MGIGGGNEENAVDCFAKYRSGAPLRQEIGMDSAFLNQVGYLLPLWLQ
jgi:hypothetical protein